MKQSNDIFLETANSIGARLCRDALWAGSRCNWLGASMEFIGNTWTVAHRAFGSELYNGSSGIALFLARLFEMTDEKLYRMAAEGGIQHALSQLDKVSPAARIGFYSGLTGIAYVLITVGEILDRRDLIDEAYKIIAMLAQDDPNEQGIDVVAGSAGAIPALLNMHRRFRDDFILALAIRHGEHLLKTVGKSEIGWSWNTLNIPQENRQQDLTGFSHGTAGIAWALLELFQATGQQRFHEAAEQGFRYERHWFSPQHQNWPDFRNLYDTTMSGNTGPSYSLAWCHGAPGIGLSRLRAYEMFREEVYRQESEVAIRTTANMLNQSAYPGQSNYSLCHGLAGNAELLLYASQILGNSEYKTFAEQVGRQGIEQYHKNNIPWPCGVLGGGETPNLMLGLAGIGYFYLRLYDSQKIPPVVIILPEER